MSVHSKIKRSGDSSGTRVLMTAVVMTSLGTRNVTIRDISRSGAQITFRDEIPKGCDVLLKRGDLCAAARVAWVKESEAGLSFYRELSPDEIERTLPTALLRGAE